MTTAENFKSLILNCLHNFETYIRQFLYATSQYKEYFNMFIYNLTNHHCEWAVTIRGKASYTYRTKYHDNNNIKTFIYSSKEIKKPIKKDLTYHVYFLNETYNTNLHIY